jgi:hypothetical protein
VQVPEHSHQVSPSVPPKRPNGQSLQRVTDVRPVVLENLPTGQPPVQSGLARPHVSP